MCRSESIATEALAEVVLVVGREVRWQALHHADRREPRRRSAVGDLAEATADQLGLRDPLGLGLARQRRVDLRFDVEARLLHRTSRLPPVTALHGPRYSLAPMPIYEYRCENGHLFEVMQKITDDPVTVCETCEAPVQRVFHPI